MMNFKDDLVHQRICDPFFLPVTLKEGEKCSAQNIITAIIKEDTAEGCTTRLNISFFKRAEEHLNKMLECLEDVRGDFQKVVDETAHRRETGRSVGWVLAIQLKKLIPQELIGGRKNKDCLLKNFSKSFLFGKEDKVPITLLTDGLIIKNIVWLKGVTSPSLKKSMLVALVRWLWRVAKRLVSLCFFVSDIQGAANQLVYIPKKVWKAESDRAFNNFMQLHPLTVDEARRLAAVRKPFTLRWMPKSEGLRPILSARGDKKCLEIKKAKNVVLSLILNSKFQLKAFHRTWRNLVANNQGRKLYFVACDIHDAFGSIIQEKLITIFKEEVMERYGPSGIKRFSNEINFIEKAVKCQTVKMMKKSYHLTKGLAQGMPLSSLLCNLYLMHMDRTILADFTSNADDKLIRAVDDYLFITPDKAKAQLFLDTMTTKLSEYGLKIKLSKTQTNFEVDLEILYYGYLINTANLEIYCRYNHGINVSSRNSMVFTKDPILLVHDKLVRMPLVKLNRVTVDRHYMTVEGVARNTQHTACVLVCRLTAILGLTRPCDIPPGDTLVSVVFQSIDGVVRRVCLDGASISRADPLLRSTAGQETFMCLTKQELKWICLHTFFIILSRAVSMKRDFPEDIVLLVSELEEVAKEEVRPNIMNLVSHIINNIPPQFRNFGDC